MRLSDIEVVETVGAITVTELRVWVREGWITPQVEDSQPVFDKIDVARIRLVCQLRDELDVGDDAVPVILSLMDQLYGLRRELKWLAHAIGEQPDTVREQVRDAYRAQMRGS